MNKSAQFLLSHPRQSVEASPHLSRENQQLREPKHQKVQYLLTERTRNQKVPLQQAIKFPEDKQTLNESPIISQRIGTELFLADFTAGKNEKTNRGQSEDLAANIQHLLNSQQSTCPYGQHQPQTDRIPAQVPFTNQPIVNEMFSKKFPNESENKTTE
jgi:hypothetical protein